MSGDQPDTNNKHTHHRRSNLLSRSLLIQRIAKDKAVKICDLKVPIIVKRELTNNIEEIIKKEHEKIIDGKINKIIETKINDNIEKYKKSLNIYKYSILALIFIVSSAGFLGKQEIKEFIRQQIINDKEIMIKNYAYLKEQINENMWKELTTARSEKYKSLFDNDDFYYSMIARHHEMSEMYKNQDDKSPEKIEQILNAGSRDHKCKLVITGKVFNNTIIGNCMKTFNHNKHHAVIAIPKNTLNDGLQYLQCGINYPKQTISIKYDDNSIDNVEIVDIIRSENVSDLELRLSQKTAEELKVPGWSKFAVNTMGSFSVYSYNGVIQKHTPMASTVQKKTSTGPSVDQNL